MDKNKTCRTCCQPFEQSRSVNLFKTIEMDNTEILQLSIMLEELTGLQFNADENDLSCRLCFECVRKICESYYFRKKCIKTDLKIRDKLKTNFEVVEANDEFYWDELVEDEIFDENTLSDGDLSDNTIDLEKGEHKCKYCGKYYNTHSYLKKHINTKHGALLKQNEIEFEYTCNECGQNYANYTNIRLHTRQKHPDYFNTRFKLEVKDNKNTYLCDFCGKGYKCPKLLNIHIRNHTGEKPYKCDICDKNFTSESFLRDHMRRHTDAKNLICVVCNKGFTRQKYLDVHVKLHDDNQLFECHICSKRFVGRGRLVFHLRYHSRLNHQKGCPPISLNKSFIASLKPVTTDDDDTDKAHDEDTHSKINSILII